MLEEPRFFFKQCSGKFFTFLKINIPFGLVLISATNYFNRELPDALVDKSGKEPIDGVSNDRNVVPPVRCRVRRFEQLLHGEPIVGSVALPKSKRLHQCIKLILKSNRMDLVQPWWTLRPEQASSLERRLGPFRDPSFRNSKTSTTYSLASSFSWSSTVASVKFLRVKISLF